MTHLYTQGYTTLDCDDGYYAVCTAHCSVSRCEAGGRVMTDTVHLVHTAHRGHAVIVRNTSLLPLLLPSGASPLYVLGLCVRRVNTVAELHVAQDP